MSALRKITESACVATSIFLLPSGAVHSQSLGDMIDRTKATKEMQWAKSNGIAAKPNGKSHTVSTLTPPLLWSLSGYSEQFQAVLLYQAKAYTVHSDDAQSWTIGPWKVEWIDEFGLQLTAHQNQQKKSVWINPLDKGSSAYPHYKNLQRYTRLNLGAPNPADLSGSLTNAQTMAAQLPWATDTKPVPPNHIQNKPKQD